MNPIEKQIPEWMQDVDGIEYPRCYELDGANILRAKENGRWHLSIARPDRLPTWDEVKDARNKCLPDRVLRDTHFCLPFPPEDKWLSIHDNALHLWELRDDQLRKQVEFETKVQRPSHPGFGDVEAPTT